MKNIDHGKCLSVGCDTPSELQPSKLSRTQTHGLMGCTIAPDHLLDEFSLEVRPSIRFYRFCHVCCAVIGSKSKVPVMQVKFRVPMGLKLAVVHPVFTVSLSTLVPWSLDPGPPQALSVLLVHIKLCLAVPHRHQWKKVGYPNVPSTRCCKRYRDLYSTWQHT